MSIWRREPVRCVFLAVVAGERVALVVDGNRDLSHAALPLLVREHGADFADRAFETARDLVGEAFERHLLDVQAREFVGELGAIFTSAR